VKGAREGEESHLEGLEDVLGAVLVRLLGGQLGLLELQELPPENLEMNRVNQKSLSSPSSH